MIKKLQKRVRFRLPRALKKRLSKRPTGHLASANYILAHCKDVVYTRAEIDKMEWDFLIQLLQYRDESGPFSYGAYVSEGDPETFMSRINIRYYAKTILCK